MSLLLTLMACLSSDSPDDTAAVDDTGAIPGPAGPSRIEPSCAPDDGLATRLVVGMEEAACDSPFDAVPHLRITLWDGAAWPLAPGTYDFDEGSGGAWYRGDDGVAEEYARSGSVTVEAAAGGTVRGTYRVELNGGGVVSGAFDALACETETMCG